MLCESRDGRLVRFHIYSTHERALAVARHGDSWGSRARVKHLNVRAGLLLSMQSGSP
jgi:hypothetical protein